MQKITLEGHFWLPQDREKQVTGTLTIDEDGRAELTLIGSLDHHRFDASRIVGVCSDGAYTLEECFLRQETISLVTRQVYGANRVYGGVEYEDGEMPTFNEFQIGVTNLTEWVQPEPIFEDLPFHVEPNGEHSPFVLKLNAAPDEVVEMESGTLRLVQNRGYDGDGLSERRLTQSMHFRFRSETALSTAEIVDIASDLQDLISIATDATAAFEYVHLYSDEVRNSHGRSEGIRLLANWHAKPGKARKNSFQMAFTLSDIGGIAGVGRWLDAAKQHRSDLGRVMNTRYVTMFTDDRLLHRVAALERLHENWKGTKNTKLRTRLKDLCNLAGRPITELLPNVEEWCEKITAERNNVAHHLGRVIHQNSRDLYFSSEVSYWLFAICLLRLQDAPDTVFDKVAEYRGLKFLAAEIRANR